jgi:predicted methyltransferase
MTNKLVPALLAALLTAGAGAAFAAAAPPAQIAAAVADPGRPAADTARDVNRKPAETVAFAGVRPGMKIAELAPGGGYYTRILSKAVGPTGKVYMIVSKAQAARPGGLDGANAIAAALGNVVVTAQDNTALALPEKVDMFWTTENYHDFHNGPTANIAAMNKSVFDSLKPGGIYYVEDHSSAPGAGLEATSKFHRMDEALAKQELIAAGFKLDGESQILRHPDDKRGEGNAEADVRGKTDRFMLRLKRP